MAEQPAKYIPPWKRSGAAPPAQIWWSLDEIDAALPAEGSHTFVIAHQDPAHQSESPPRFVRIMQHAHSGVRGQPELWTRHHLELLASSVGLRLPLFQQSTISGPPADSRKRYEYLGWHAIDHVEVHAGGSDAVQAFVKARDESKRKHTPQGWNRAFNDSWACVKVSKCDAEVQNGLGDPMAKWVAAGRPARPPEIAEAVPDDEHDFG